MKIGFIGLGRMGGNMVENLLDKKHDIVVYNRSPEKIAHLVKRKGKKPIASSSVSELIDKLPKQKIIWIMIKSGKPVDDTIKQLIPYLKKGDIIIDGGNSFFKDSQRRFLTLKKLGIHFLDCGVSGGISGARHGACIMVGGNKDVFRQVEPLIRDMCVKDGYGYTGLTGAGHFVKGIHNGIEYGMMGALAEGMSAIAKHEKEFKTDLKEVIKVYNHGSIIQSRLTDWLQKGMNRNYFSKISGVVPKGETEEEMAKLEKFSYMPILNKSRLMRISTRKKPSLAGKFISVMRNEFGGHGFNKK